MIKRYSNYYDKRTMHEVRKQKVAMTNFLIKIAKFGNEFKDLSRITEEKFEEKKVKNDYFPSRNSQIIEKGKDFPYCFILIVGIILCFSDCLLSYFELISVKSVDGAQSAAFFPAF